MDMELPLWFLQSFPKSWALSLADRSWHDLCPSAFSGWRTFLPGHGHMSAWALKTLLRSGPVAVSCELGTAVAQFGPMKLNDVCDSWLYEKPLTYRAEADRQGRYLVPFQVLTPAWFGTVPRQ